MVVRVVIGSKILDIQTRTL